MTAEAIPKERFESPHWLGEVGRSVAYYTFNPDGVESILLLHGAMTGAAEWNLVIPHVPSRYQVIAVDVPLHHNSKDVELGQPGRETAGQLSQLIRKESKDGQAHIVGLSMGAHLGRSLAVRHPEVVKSCFLSGYANLASMPMKNYLPHIVYVIEGVGSIIPKSWIDGIEYATDTKTPHDFGHFKKVWILIMDDEDIRDRTWTARTLVVAASKGGLIPTNDSIKDAKSLSLLAEQGNSESRAVQNKTMRHGWSRQDPKLFADAIICWIEGRPLPSSFEAI